MMATTLTPNFNVPSSIMSKIGLKEKELIRKDSLEGIGQDGRKWGIYLSQTYVKYKSNWMNRFTDKRGNKGTKLKTYQGQAIVSNQTSFVNMTLTGQMANGLHIESVKDNEVTMSYLPKDAGKIIGNEDLGRVVVGLNDKNQEIIKDEIIKYLNKNIDEWAREDIVINVGRV